MELFQKPKHVRCSSTQGNNDKNPIDSSMPLFLLDTNILILHIADIEPISLSVGVGAVSSVTVFELLRYPGMSLDEQRKIEKIVDTCVEIHVSGSIARRAAKIAATRSKMKSLDLLIAATAMVYDLPLVTKNIKDFRGVKGLKLRSAV